MQFLYFIIVAIVSYFLADQILQWLERFLDRTLEQRQLIFFGILLVLLLSSFAVVRSFVE